MAQAKHDSNQVPAILGTSNADGSTPTRIYADPTSHVMSVMDGTTGSDLGGNPAPRDQNGETVMMAVSSADGVTPVAIYADPATGDLLVKST